MKFKVNITHTYGAFAVVEAADADEAEDIAREFVDDGTIDVVDLKGTQKNGYAEVVTRCAGKTDDLVTATREEE